MILLRIPQRLLQPFHIPCHCIHLPLHPLHNSFQPLNTGLGIPGSRGCEPILLPHFIHPARQLTLKGMRRGGLSLSLHSCPCYPRLGTLLSDGNFTLSCVQRHRSCWSVALLRACKGRALLLRIVRHPTQHWRCKKLKQANTIKCATNYYSAKQVFKSSGGRARSTSKKADAATNSSYGTKATAGAKCTATKNKHPRLQKTNRKTKTTTQMLQ